MYARIESNVFLQSLLALLMIRGRKATVANGDGLKVRRMKRSVEGQTCLNDNVEPTQWRTVFKI